MAGAGEPPPQALAPYFGVVDIGLDRASLRDMLELPR